MAEEKIKHNDIIEENVFQPAATSADILLAKLNELIKSFKELATLTGKKVPLTDPKTLDEAQQIAAALEKIRDAEKGLTEVQKVQIQAQAIVNKQKKEFRDSLKVETATVENSTQALRRMQRELANLPAGSKEFNKLAKEAGLLKDKINDAKDAVKAFSSESKLTNAKTLFGQIGNDLKDLNFADAADKAKILTGVIKSMSFSEVIGGIKNFGTTIIELGKSLLLNPFVLVATAIAGLIVVLAALPEAFREGNASLDAATKRSDALRESINKLRDELNDLTIDEKVRNKELTETQGKALKQQEDLKNKIIQLNRDKAEELKKIEEDFAKEREDDGFQGTKNLLDAIGFETSAVTKKNFAIERANKDFDEKKKLLLQISSKQFGKIFADEQAEILKNNAVSKTKEVNQEKQHTKTIIEEKKKQNTDFSITQKDPFGTPINSPSQSLAEFEAEEKKQRDFNQKRLEDEAQADADMIALADKWAAEDKKIRDDRRKEEIDNTFKALDQITSGISEGLKKRSDLQQQADQRDIDMHARMLDVQARLAAEGQDNVLAETMAQTAKAEEKKIQDAKKAAKQQEAIAIIETFTSALQTALKDDKKPFMQAFGEALAASGMVSAVFSKMFAGFYEGTTDTGTTDSPLDAKGGRVAVLHDNERVVPKRLNDQLDGISNDELVRRAVSPDLNSTFFPKIAEVPVHSYVDYQVLEMTKEIKALRNDMASRPVQSNRLERLGEWTEQIQEKNVSTIIHHKKSTSRPSLRLNG